MKTGSSHKNINLLKQILGPKAHIKLATVFGSLAKNRLHRESDIDVAIAGEAVFSAEFLFDLTGELNSQLPHPVDIIDLNRVSGPILQQALCTGILLKSTSPVLYSGLIKKMWYNQADMMPYTKMILRKHCDRFIHG